MNKCSSLFLALSLVLFGNFTSGAFADEAPEEIKPSPSIQVPLHPDWYVVNYDEVKDLTTFETKDEFGPGNPPRCTHGDAIKVDLLGILEGKALGPQTKFTAKFYFYRMAGLARDSDIPLLKGHDDRFQPFDQDSKRLRVFNEEDIVYFLTAAGERFSEKDNDITYDTKFSKGFLGEIYLWETVTAALSWDEINQLTEGGKVEIGDRVIVLGPDQISLVRSLIAAVHQLKP